MADDKKVFDVSSPGKSKPDATAKPVIIGHKVQVSDGTVNPDKPQKEEKEIADPLAGKAETPVAEVNESKLSPTSEKKLIPSDELVKEVNKQKTTAEDSPKSEEKAEDSPKEDEKKPEPAKEPDKPEKSVGNEQAVNTVLGDAGNAKQAEVEALEKQEKVKKLVEEGKYTLPIGQPRKHHGKIKFWQGLLILLAVIFVTIAGFVLAVDAEYIKSDYKLPFDLIKKSQPTTDSTQSTTTTTNTPKDPTTIEKTVCFSKDANSAGVVVCTDKTLNLSFSYPKEWGDFKYSLTEMNDQNKNKSAQGQFSANKKIVIGMVTPKIEIGSDGACYAALGIGAQAETFNSEYFVPRNAKDSTSESIGKFITNTADKKIIEQYEYYNFDTEDFESGLGMCPGLSFAGAVKFSSEYAGVQFSWSESENFKEGFKTSKTDLDNYKKDPNLTLSAIERKKILDFINSIKQT